MDVESVSSGESSKETESKEDPRNVATFCSRSKRFSTAQRACLQVYYSNGMTRTGKKYSSLIAKAANDTNLSVKQVKV